VITFAKTALLLLQLAKLFADWGRARADYQAGEDAAIGRAAREVLAATAWGRRIAETIDAMDKRALDDLTDALGEPAGAGDAGGADDLGRAGRG
jgi:hypothetical protein